MPTQGARATLARALRSALAQTFTNFEIILVDDSVVDRGWRARPEIAAWLADPRIRIVPFHEGRGCAAAKNAGLRAAQGEWVCYLDDDNEYRPEKIAAQAALANATGCPLVLCGVEIRIAARRRVRQCDAESFAGDDLLLRVLPDTNTLFHRRATGIWWDESLGTVDDACFFHALIAHHALEYVPNVPQPLAIYYAHGAERANRAFDRFYRGQRCLVTRWSRRFSPQARRILLLRSLVAFEKYRPGRWSQLTRRGAQLIAAGGWREWRVVANAIGVKMPGLRRWMVT